MTTAHVPTATLDRVHPRLTWTLRGAVACDGGPLWPCPGRCAVMRIGTIIAGLGAVCGAIGPAGARCEIRHGHVARHGGMTTKGEWVTW